MTNCSEIWSLVPKHSQQRPPGFRPTVLWGMETSRIGYASPSLDSGFHLQKSLSQASNFGEMRYFLTQTLQITLCTLSNCVLQMLLWMWIYIFFHCWEAHNLTPQQIYNSRMAKNHCKMLWGRCSDYLKKIFFFSFWPHQQHVEAPRPGTGLNPCHSSNPSLCSDSTGSLTTRKHLKKLF